MTALNAVPACCETGRIIFWSNILTQVLVSGIGVYFIVHGRYLMAVIPDERFPPDSLFSVAIGTDKKLYSLRQVIQFARFMMVILGTLLVVLPWIVPMIH